MKYERAGLQNARTSAAARQPVYAVAAARRGPDGATCTEVVDVNVNLTGKDEEERNLRSKITKRSQF